MTKRVQHAGRALAGGHDRLRRKTLSMLLAGCFACGVVQANPVGPQVVNGSATFTNQGNILSIINTPGAIINWQSFSIDANETTRFIQQSASSAVLNRILGQDPSRILGALQSNGKVFLINPNGVLFGQGSQIDVNGLVASTLNISNEDFIAGRLNFKAGANAGNIKNQGAITTPSGGQVFLIAPNVENSGIITSPKGDVVLAAGHTVNLVDSSNPDVQVVLSAPEHQALNLGQVIAQGGRIGIYGALVNQRGLVSANSAVVGENGKIVFKASKDTILDAGSITTATGEGKGGEIRILGDRVGLLGDAKVDASGKTGGGAVLVGGDYQGKNPGVQNAQRTYVGADTWIRADALRTGDGGKIVIWSDEATRAYGRLSAQGGPQGGNGGFIETSGHYLDVAGIRADTSATTGSAGTWLLDPYDITISNTANSNGSFSGGIWAAVGPAASSVVSTSDLASALNNSNVTISTVGDGQGTGSGTIMISDPVSWTAAKSLTLNADANIVVNNTVTLPASGTLNLNANTAIAVNSTITGDSGSTINMYAGQGGASGGIALGAAISADNIGLRAAMGDITQTVAGTITATSLFAYADHDSVKLGTAANDVGTISGYTASNGTEFSFKNASALTIGSTGTAVGSGNGIMTFGKPITVTTTSGDITLNNAAYGLCTNGADGNGHCSTSTVGGGSVTLNAGGAVSAANGTITTDWLKISASGGVFGATEVNALSTQVNSINVLNSGSGPIRIGNSGSDLSIADIGSVHYGVKNMAIEEPVALSTTVGHAINVHAPISSNIGEISLNGLSGVNVYASADTPEISSAGGAITLYASNPDAKISLAAGTQIASGGGDVNLTADHIQLLGSVNAGSGNVTLAPSAATAIKIGSGANSANTTSGVLELGEAELQNITTSSELLILGTGPVTLDVAGSLDLQTPGKLTGTLMLGTSGGAITTAAGGAIKAPEISMSSYSGAVSNNATIVADKSINLNSSSGAIMNTGAITSSTSYVSIGSTDGAVSNAAAINAADSVSLNSNTGSVTNSGAITAGMAILMGTGAGDVSNSAALSGMQVSLNTGNGTVTNTGPITATSFANLAADFGDVSNSNAITSSGTVDIEASNGKLTNSGNVTASSAVFLTAQKMDLASTGTAGITAGGTSSTGYVKISTDGPVDLGSTVDTGTGLELSSAELASIHAGMLKIETSGEAISPINISAPLSGGPTALSLSANGNITQAPGAIIGGVTKLAVSGADVNLPEANPVGVIAGRATAGSFVYRSSNGIMIQPVDNLGGIELATGTGSIKLKSDTSNIMQAAGSVSTPANTVLGTESISTDIAYPGAIRANGGGLVLEAAGDVWLANTSNNFAKLAAKINTNGATGSSSSIYSQNIDVNSMTGMDGVTNIAGISTNNGMLELSTGIVTNTLTVSAPIAAGTSGVELETDNLALNNTVTAAGVRIHPHSSGRPITLGSSVCNTVDVNSGCLTLSSLYNVVAPVVVIGSSDAGEASGSIYVAGITNAGGTLSTDRNTVTKRIGLLSGGGVTQAAGTAINVQDLGVQVAGGQSVVLTNAANKVTNLAGETDGGNFTFANATNLNVVSASGAIGTDPYSLPGINAGTGVVKLTSGGAIGGTGAVVGAGVDLTAVGGMTLTTQTSSLKATNTGSSGDIAIVNTGALTLDDIKQTAIGGTGSINIDNTGALTLAAGKTVSTDSGSITLTAYSPLTVNGTISSTSGTVALEAGSTGQTSDQLTIASGASVTTGGAVTMKAGSAIDISGTVTAPNVTKQANQNSTPTSTPTPTLSDCIANPSLTGCSSVLPTLTQCISAPTTAGCSAVLPTLDQCISSPTTAGCSVVLPTLTQCIATPTQSGCSAVLPTLDKCSADNTIPGCIAVLPTLAQCATAPATSGCAVVLPTLTQCIADKTLAGCTAVLPTLDKCVLDKTVAGCSVVLPTLTQCVADKTVAGCTAVLPTLTQCVADKTLAGCAAVLPTVTQCIADKTGTGCSIVLPTLSQCIADTSLAGCSVILPTVVQCVADKGLTGCSVVLPTLSQCVADKTVAGCSIVLPTLAQCVADKTAAGCSIVLPTLAQCTAASSLDGCSVVLPTLTQCTTNQALEGCSAVLPTVAVCSAAPTTAGCEVVLPTTPPSKNEPVTQEINSAVNTINKAINSAINIVDTTTQVANPITTANAGGTTIKPTSTAPTTSSPSSSSNSSSSSSSTPDATATSSPAIGSTVTQTTSSSSNAKLAQAFEQMTVGGGENSFGGSDKPADSSTSKTDDKSAATASKKDDKKRDAEKKEESKKETKKLAVCK